MRHRKNNVGLNRTASHRRALLANLASALFTHKKIVTTLPKARQTRMYAERLITFARKGDLAARRHVLRKITDKTVVKELFDTIGPRFRERHGGYTRIIKLDNRLGDNAPMAILELVGFAADDAVPAKKTSRPKTADTPKAKPEAPAQETAEPVVEETEQATAPVEEAEAVAEETPAAENQEETSSDEEDKKE